MANNSEADKQEAKDAKAAGNAAKQSLKPAMDKMRETIKGKGA